MTDDELKLELLRICRGEMHLAKEAFDWIKGAGTADPDAFPKAGMTFVVNGDGTVDTYKQPLAKAVGCDGNLDEPFRSILSGAEPSVGNEPMKETEVRFKDYKPE